MLIATIREQDCIGCAKCLPACPVDAILGAPKFLHSVLLDECIGCKLCVAPCPMNCIDMIENEVENTNTKKIRATKAKERYIAKQQRLIQKQKPQLINASHNLELKEKIRDEISAAIARVNAKRINKNENEQEDNDQEENIPGIYAENKNKPDKNEPEK